MNFKKVAAIACIFLFELSFARTNHGAESFSRSRITRINSNLTQSRFDNSSNHYRSDGDRYDRYRNDRYSDRGSDRGNYSCVASDKGWEEHWGGHSSCGECLKKHGECVEICSEDYYVCKAEGTDSNGYTREVTNSGSSQWRTEDNVLDRCSDSGLFNCRSKGCSQQNEVISRRGC